MRKQIYGILIAILMAALLIGCRGEGRMATEMPRAATTSLPPATEAASAQPSDTAAPNTETPAPTATTPSPSITLTPLPSNTPTASLTPTQTPTLTAAPSATLTQTPLPTSLPEQRTASPGTGWNLRLVGHNSIGAIGWHGSLALADHCAYVGNYRRSAVAILDISDPANPSLLEPLQLPAGTVPVEVRTIPDLDLLVVTDLSSAARLLTYDISDCTAPQQLGAMNLVHPTHEFYLWRGESRVLAYVATFDHHPPNLIVVDLTDPTQPQEVARWNAAEDGVQGILHSLSVSRDGTRAYLAMWDGGLVILDVDLPRIEALRGPEGDFSPARFPNTHSAVPLEANFVLLASEVFECPFEGLAVADISDPAYPEIISRFRLPENRCQNLPGPPGGTFTPHNPLVVGEMALVSWHAAGVQAVDLSDPTAPRRLGQFVPQSIEGAPTSLLGNYPIQMFSYPIVREGLIYVTDSVGGLYVLRYTGPRADWLAGVTHAESNVTVLP